jgi:hypothetical protein
MNTVAAMRLLRLGEVREVVQGVEDAGLAE